MPDNAATEKFMKSLLSKKVASSLEKIAALPQKDRRAAISNPTPYLSKAGLKLPPGVTVKVTEQPFNPDEVPRELLPQFPPLQRPVLICFWFCEWFIGPHVVIRRCVLVCVRGELVGGSQK